MVATGCGGGNDQCKAACDPGCPAGTICSADVHGHTTAMWTGVCLQLCTQPADCTGGLSCRSFGGTPYVCASDALPALCPAHQTYTDDILGDGPYCYDAQTLAAAFDSPMNGTHGHELRSCANGCDELVDGNGFPMGARCR